MANKYNPFRPDKIAPPGIFAGRLDELGFIDQCLLQTKHGNPQHFLVEGERGIGKSSILMCEQFVALGEMKTMETSEKLDFIVISITLHERDTYFGIIKKISAALKRELDRRHAFKTLALRAVDLVSRIEAYGFSLHRDHEGIDEEAELFDGLQEDFVELLTKIEGEADGVLLLIDEADKPPSDAGLGTMCKLLTEELSKRRCERLCIGLAGLPRLIQALKESHESSLRIFRTMSLKPLEDNERYQVIDRGLKEASEKNPAPVSITPEAKALIAGLSEGYPHFLQEFAYAAFEEDSDNVIDQEDVSKSLFRENGAFDQLGRKFFNEYYDAPDSDDYRKVLHTMADHSDNWVSRATIIAESGLKGSTVDNALRALKGKNIIAPNEKKAGEYRLPTKSFAVWIKAREAAADKHRPP